MKVLLVVDVQNDFCPGGALAVEGGNEIVPVINDLMERGSFDLIAASQDWHPENHMSFKELWPVHCVQGTSGAEFHPDLRTEEFDLIIQKGTDPEIDSYSAFFDNEHLRETPLRKALLELRKEHPVSSNKPIEIAICGLATDYCVAATARDAASFGFKTSIVLDATRAVEQDQRKNIQLLRELQDLGIEVVESKTLLPEISRNPHLSRDQDRSLDGGGLRSR